MLIMLEWNDLLKQTMLDSVERRCKNKHLCEDIWRKSSNLWKSLCKYHVCVWFWICRNISWNDILILVFACDILPTTISVHMSHYYSIKPRTVRRVAQKKITSWGVQKCIRYINSFSVALLLVYLFSKILM